MIWWITAVLVVLSVIFFFIAREGRKLRTAHPLPDESARASLETADGKQYHLDSQTHFYLGSHPGNQIVLTNAKGEYSVCIFHHRRRFAFQTLSGIPEIRVNGEEQMAGYLFDGDVLAIDGESFTFKVMSNQ